MNKKMIKIIDKAFTDANELYNKLYQKRETLKRDIYNRYPVDAYGIKADLVYEDKSIELDNEMKEVRYLLIGLQHIKEDITDVMKGE